jgi:crotonobetainyl-CoA:carnitine CoA-transferase CaiB-like acyl-CoA transferase
MFEDIDHPSEGATRVLRSPFTVAGNARVPDAPAPRLGENTRAILAEAGFSAVQIDALLENGAANEADPKDVNLEAR